MTATASAFVDSMRAAALPASGIGWLDAARREAMQAFLAHGLPDTRDELWKYTALRALERRAYAPQDAKAGAVPVDPSAFALPGIDGPRMVFVNGVFRADLSRLDDLPDGLRVTPLSRALAENPEPLRFLLARHAEHEDVFMALNRALAAEGALVRVAPDARIDAPLHVVHVGAPVDASLAWHARQHVELGGNARLRLIEHHVAHGDHAHLLNAAGEYVLHEGAGLDLLVLQDAADAATLLRRSDFQLHEHARLSLHALELGGALARHELRVSLDGEGARIDSRGAFALRGRQHADVELLIDHRGRNTTSDSLWRGVADGRARGVFHGSIAVRQGADGADAQLSNKNLLLSESAEIDTRPALEIHADEVKAAHGATVGQLDERALFYLRSRGIDSEHARALLVRAFCAAALSGIEPAALREHGDALLLAHLPRGEEE